MTIIWQVAPELLIKGVTVVRTAKGSGHVLVTTADQVTLNAVSVERKLILLGEKTDFGGKKNCFVGINADHLQPDSVISALPLRQGEILWTVRGSSGEHQSAEATNISGKERWPFSDDPVPPYFCFIPLFFFSNQMSC